MLQVHLVADAGGRRHHPEAAERLLAPAQELVALDVAPVLQLDVAGQRLGPPEHVDLDRVVDDQVGRDERVEPLRVAPSLGDGVAQRRQVDHGRDAREVLHQHAGGEEADLAVVGDAPAAARPGRQRGHVVLGDGDAVDVTGQVLEQHLQREGQPLHPRRQRRQAVDVVLPVAHVEPAERAEIRHHLTVPVSAG